MEPTKLPPFHKRARMKGFDYRSAGMYGVTVVTRDRECTLGNVENFEVILTKLGGTLLSEISMVPVRFPTIDVDSFVIMPNHFHLLLWFKENMNPDLSRVVNELKSRTTVQYHKQVGKVGAGTLWQHSFYDTIMRDENHLFRARQYIQNNPAKWALDELHPDQWL